MLHLDANQIRELLPMPEAIGVVAEAFRQLSCGGAHMPVRTHLSRPDGDTFFMPASVDHPPALGVKIVSVRPGNRELGLPTVPALVLLFDPDTGVPLALVEGTSLTLLRTGAAVGLATDLLSRQDAASVAMIGAGALAPSCLEAVCTVRAITNLHLHSRTRSRTEELAAWCRETLEVGLIRVHDSAGEAIADADVIVCATTSATPVCRWQDLRPGTHVNAVGSYRPDMQEVDSELVANARVVVDSREACLLETGDLIVPIRQKVLHRGGIHAELGEIVAGKKHGRDNEVEITLFKSVGTAVQDVATAQTVLNAWRMTPK